MVILWQALFFKEIADKVYANSFLTCSLHCKLLISLTEYSHIQKTGLKKDLDFVFDKP